uniref:M28 family metallopeptidase n=1 Tax=uncultured Draconibacterium sp. TaxID=1573823 RepID=UPI0032179E37
MFIRKIVLVSYFLCLISFIGFAQTDALQKIDITDLKRHLGFIASDELQGRRLGTEVDGLKQTANYLADYAREIGLKPGAENYFQNFSMYSVKADKNNFIEVATLNNKTVFNSNSLLFFGGVEGSKKLRNSTVVLGGFGDKLKNESLKEQVLVVAQGNAESFNKGDDIRLRVSREMEKLKKIEEKEPGVIIVVTSPQDKDNKGFNRLKAWFSQTRYTFNTGDDFIVPVLFSTPDFADALLGGKGKYKKYLSKVAKGNSSGWQPVQKKSVSLQAEIVSDEVHLNNIIGVVEGSDPKLKDEYVVFMAHYDHLGMGKGGEVFNGADDNGSGTVAIMEVAEAFMSLDKKPKRSIVFLWTTCEEMGHLGSRYYCDHPVFPLQQTVAAINLDMVGRVYEEQRDDIWKNSPKKIKGFNGLYTLANKVWPELAEINNRKCKEIGLVPDSSLPEHYIRASDHYHFHKNGVPVLNYSTGYHADYHKVGDEVEKINFDKIKRVADLCFLVGLEVANTDNIKF